MSTPKSRLGTLLKYSIIAAIFFIFGIVFITSLQGWFHVAQNNEQNALFADTNTDEEKNKVRQYISLGTPKLIDTLARHYIVPVGQVKATSETTENSDNYSGSIGRRKSYYKGNYNNLIFYNEKTEEHVPVFEQKLLISRFYSDTIQGKRYLFMTVYLEDTNNDGKIATNDLSSFALYDISLKQLKIFSFMGLSLVDYSFAVHSNKIFLRYLLDMNKDGKAELRKEPTIIKIIDLKDKKVKELLKPQEIEALRTQID